MSLPSDMKSQVKDHWEEEACGTRYGASSERRDYFDQVLASRYERTPYLRDFAQFEQAAGKSVLEIGVGAGSDFYNWIVNGALVTGIDLTDRAIAVTREHLDVRGITPSEYALLSADAEKLPFEDNHFDIVYSYGVLHHTPNTEIAIKEAFRVLKPNGDLRIMIYHRPSWTGFMLWIRYSLLRFRPWVSQRQVIFENLESPGTKAYTTREARRMLTEVGFQDVKLNSKLCAGDLLDIKPSKKYQGRFYRLAWMTYPRWLVRLLGNRYGLNLLVQAKKPTS